MAWGESSQKARICTRRPCFRSRNRRRVHIRWPRPITTTPTGSLCTYSLSLGTSTSTFCWFSFGGVAPLALAALLSESPIFFSPSSDQSTFDPGVAHQLVSPNPRISFLGTPHLLQKHEIYRHALKIISETFQPRSVYSECIWCM
jgi:hypothetical protein